jgi:hypothetical protein
MGARRTAARIELDLAPVLAKDRRREPAREAAGRALASAEALGMSRLEGVGRAVLEELQGVASLSLRRKR